MWMRTRSGCLSLPVAAVVVLLTPPLSAQQPEFKVTEEALEPLSFEMRREIAGLHYLLNAHQLRQFFSLPSDEERRVWIDRWWRSQDPTPTSGVNEMKLEHERRVRASRVEFGWKDWPGWDHRGEVWIRYGPPDLRYDLDWEVSQAGVQPPAERWYYSRFEMSVIFEDFNLTGRYTFAMLSLGNPDRKRTRGGASLYGPEADTGKPIDADFDPPRNDMPPPPTNWWYVYLNDKELARINNFREVYEEYRSTYPFNFNRKEIPYAYGVYQFKGGDSLTRLEVDVEFLAASPPVHLEGETQKFTVASALFDEAFNVVDRRARRVSITAKELPRTSPLWFPSQLVFSLPRDYYRVAITVEEAGSGRSTSYRSTVLVNDYSTQTSISDVLFCSKISPVSGESPFNRGALEVVPHPRRRYAVTEAIPAYFELYNLDVDAAGMSQYEVEYWIVPRGAENRGPDGTDTYAASRFEGSDYGSDVPLNVSIDTDNLWAGDFEFHVRLTDRRTLFTAERTALFHLVE